MFDSPISLIFLYVTHIVLFLVPKFRLFGHLPAQTTLPKLNSSATAKMPVGPTNRSIIFAQIRIYSLCLSLAASIFLLLLSLNLWPEVISDSLKPLATIQAYLLFSIALSLPWFYVLQVALHRKRTGSSIAGSLFVSQPVRQTFLFSYVLLTLLPLIEIARLALGFSTFNSPVVWTFAFNATVNAIYPIVAFTALGTSYSSLSRWNFAVFNVKSLPQTLTIKNCWNNLLVSRRDFHVDLLKDKSDEDLSLLIESAKNAGFFERAAEISKYLLDRNC